MHLTVTLAIVDAILHTDQNIIYELLGVTNSPIVGNDPVATVVQDFAKFRYLDILALSIEAGLI